MGTKILERLSSDFLYTYTSKFKNLPLMLEFGLRHSLNIEKVPYKNSIQQNFIICFCDILPEHVDYHKTVYGNYSMAFTKEWGIKNGVTPLRYIHENSPGAHVDYLRLKNDFRIARESLKDGNQLDYFLSLITFIKARENGLLVEDSIHEQQKIKPIDAFLDQVDKDFDSKKTSFGDSALMNIFNDWVIPVLHLLEKSIDELEKRDAFLRVYQDDFRHVKNKVLYDEREWRSVRFITEEENKINPNKYSEALSNKFLPSEYNLHFKPRDVQAIIVETDIEKENLKTFLKSKSPALDGFESLVVTFNEHLKAI